MSALDSTPRSVVKPSWPGAVATTSQRARVVARPTSATLALGAILLFGLVARVVVAFTMPPWQAPDEPKHFEYIRVLVDRRATLWAERRLPRLDDAHTVLQREIIASLAEHQYWKGIFQPTPDPLPTRFDDVWPGGTHTQLHRPSLYYFLAAPLLYPINGRELETQLRVVRLYSVVLSTLTIWVVYVTARIVVRNDPFVPLVSAAFVAALPMHVYIGASINNGNLESLMGATICLTLIWGVCRGFSLKTWLLVIGAFVLGLATKRGIIGLAPTIGLAWLFWLPTLRGWRLGLGLGTLGAAVLAALVVLDALAPDIGLGLSWLLPSQLRVRLTEYALNGPEHLSRLLEVKLSPVELYQLILWHQMLLFRSFWGVFGWFSVHLTPALYDGLTLVTGLCVLGFGIWLGQQVWAARRPSAALARRNVLVGLLCLAAIGTMVVLAEAERLAFYTPAQVPQGRYLFVAIGPIAVALALGARTLLPARWLGTRWPFLLIMLGLLILDTYIYIAYLLPFFRSGVPG